MPARKRLISIVIPCFNEMESLPALHERLRAVVDARPDDDFEIIFVNDASTDNTTDILDRLAAESPTVKVLHLAKNRGHQIAMTAGFDYARGDVIVSMDADLQDPPEAIPALLEKIEEGYEIVHARRRARAGETKFKLITARLFYKLMRLAGGREIIEEAGDFRALTRAAARIVRSFCDAHSFLRGICATVGFKQTTVDYDRDARFAGASKYSLRRMLALSLDAFFGWSNAPLRVIAAAVSIQWFVAAVLLFESLSGYRFIPANWSSPALLVVFSAALVLTALGILAVYAAAAYETSRRRPLYWVRDARNITE
jgi:polyisoprenyl-phosphate glycosyltransferase